MIKWGKHIGLSILATALTMQAVPAFAQCEVQEKPHYIGFQQYDDSGNCYSCIGYVNSCGDLESYTCSAGCTLA